MNSGETQSVEQVAKPEPMRLSRAGVQAHLVSSYRNNVPQLESAIANAPDGEQRERLRSVLSVLRGTR